MPAIFHPEHADLTVPRLRSPVDPVFPIHEVSAEGPHDTAVTGDQHMLIVLLLQLLEKRAAPCDKRCDALHPVLLRARKKLRQRPVQRHRQTHLRVPLLLEAPEVRLDQPLIDDDLIHRYVAHDSARFDRTLQRTRIDRIEVHIPELRPRCPCLGTARLVQRLIRPPLHKMLLIQICLPMTR